MRKITLVLALLTANAQAECFIRKEIFNTGSAHIESVDNQQETSIRQPNGLYKCNHSFRVKVNNVWHWAERSAEAKTAPMACSAAREATSAWLLERVPDGEFQQTTETICDSRKTADVRSVQIGQVINVSDVQPHPRYPNPIRPVDAPNMTCRVFLENEIRPTGLAVQYTGYVCQTGQKWTVWKKWESSRIDN